MRCRLNCSLGPSVETCVDMSECEAVLRDSASTTCEEVAIGREAMASAMPLREHS
jgi:hypothetical protein